MSDRKVTLITSALIGSLGLVGGIFFRQQMVIATGWLIPSQLSQSLAIGWCTLAAAIAGGLVVSMNTDSHWIVFRTLGVVYSGLALGVGLGLQFGGILCSIHPTQDSFDVNLACMTVSCVIAAPLVIIVGLVNLVKASHNTKLIVD